MPTAFLRRVRSVNSVSMTVLLPVMIATGLLTGRYGRKPFMLFACALGIVGALPVFWLLNRPSVAMRRSDSSVSS